MKALVRIEVCGICNSTDHKLINGTIFLGAAVSIDPRPRIGRTRGGSRFACSKIQGERSGHASEAISLSETASVLRHLPKPRGQKILLAGTGVAGLAFALWFKLAGAQVIGLGAATSVCNTRGHLERVPPLIPVNRGF